MKKTITLWLMLLLGMGQCFATDYLIEEDGYLLKYFQKSGTPSEVYLNCDQEIVTTKSEKKLIFTYGGNLTWYNMQVKVLNCWYVWSFGKFDINYKLYYKEATKNTYTLATEGTHFYIDEDIAQHEAPIIDYERNISVIDKKPFEYNITWQLPSGLKEGTYDFKIELSVRPNDVAPTNTPTVGKHYENGADNIFCKYESALKYINGDTPIVQTTSSDKNRSGGKTKMEYVNSHKSVIHGNSTANPLNDEGYRLVYNHPDAVFNISLSTDNTPVDTIINNKKYDGYSTFICGVGESYQIPSVSAVNQELTDCANGKISPSSNNLRYLDFVKTTNPTVFQFIEKKYNNKEYIHGVSQLYVDGAYGIIRMRPILLQTINQQGTLFNENAISKLSDFEKMGGRWFSRTYHVRDLWQAKLPSSNLDDHLVFKVWNKMHYSNTIVHDITNAMGCTSYGPASEVISTYASQKENYPFLYLGENCLMFKLIPQVTFPNLSADEQAEVRICATNDTANIIHLVGKSIVCDNTSPTVYSPHYIWQVSTNAVTWKNIADNDINRVNNFDVNSQIAVDSKDILLKSSILSNGKPLYFRQLCVLKAFASTEESDLYNYPIEINGKTYYYISVVSHDYYTYRALSKPLAQNFGFTHYNWPENTYLCNNEPLTERNIRFDIVGSNNLSNSEATLLRNNAHYRVYQLQADGSKKLVAAQNHYYIPALPQDSVTYQCVIALCNDSLSKSFTIHRLPKDNIWMQQIKSNAAIAKADSINGYLQLWCLENSSPSITIQNNQVGDAYEYRAVVAKKQPRLLQYDWNALSRNECYQIILQEGWDFEGDTGFSLDDATHKQIKEYGALRQDWHNQQQEQWVMQDSIQQNQWLPFMQNIEGTTQLTYHNERPNPSFYIRKTNAFGCVSDSIKIELKYVPAITGNRIEFKHTASDTVFVPSGDSNPYIVGSYPVLGGYGEVNQAEGISFTYQWMRKSSNDEWEPIVINSRYYAQVTDSGTKKINSSTKYVSLPDETLKDLQENWEIARFVFSRKNNDEASQIVSVSNSLWMLSSALLSEENIQVFNAECPNEKVSVVVNEPDELINKNTRYIWSASDPSLVLSTISTQYSNTDNKCIINKATTDFTLSVYRYDTKTGVRSNTVTIPISIDAFNTGFSIVYNNYEYDLKTKLVVPPGSKIQLINQTVNAEEHLNQWVLQLQENYMGDGRTVEGTTSNLVHPACYLYNLGQHKIKLTTTSKNGCNETVLAENIFVEGAEGRNMQSYFETEDSYQLGHLWIQEVSPTLLNAQNGYTLFIHTNKPTYSIALYNIMGQTLIVPTTVSGNYELPLHHLEQGFYLLQVDGKNYKICKQ